jgi:hypothetical protein
MTSGSTLPSCQRQGLSLSLGNIITSIQFDVKTPVCIQHIPREFAVRLTSCPQVDLPPGVGEYAVSLVDTTCS